MGSRENYFGSVGRQNNNNRLKFQDGRISKCTDHQVKETYHIISTQVTYETGHISLLRDSTMPSAINCFLCILS